MDKESGIKPSHEEVLREIFDAWVESMHTPSLYEEFDSWKAGYEAGAAAEREALKGNAEPVAWMRKDNPGGHWQTVMASDGEYGAFPVYTYPRIPDGWVMVPKEPTSEMLDSGYLAGVVETSLAEIWEAMLAAAPKPNQE